MPLRVIFSPDAGGRWAHLPRRGAAWAVFTARAKKPSRRQHAGPARHDASTRAVARRMELQLPCRGDPSALKLLVPWLQTQMSLPPPRSSAPRVRPWSAMTSQPPHSTHRARPGERCLDAIPRPMARALLVSSNRELWAIPLARSRPSTCTRGSPHFTRCSCPPLLSYPPT